MCEVSEKIYQEGIEAGRISGLREGRSEGLKEGRNEGLKEGCNEGLKEGRLESQKETAKNLFDMGMSADAIAQALRVSVKVVQEWLSGSKSPIR